MKKILIIGSGGREHAIGAALFGKDRQLFFAPGNGGTEEIGTNLFLSPDDIPGLLDFAVKEKVDFTVVGPEAPLVMGIVDAFKEKGLRIFGPNKRCAALEGSKIFSKGFCERHGIPTAPGMTVDPENVQDAREYANTLLARDRVAVCKADGLCGGKGVVLAESPEEVDEFFRDLIDHKKYGEPQALVEKFYSGFEVSALLFCDGRDLLPLPFCRDHKKAGDGDRGLNTGGMGTYSPNLEAQAYTKAVEEEIYAPLIQGIRKELPDYRGILFVGIMITDEGPKVLEFNVRFGDPETQSVLQRLDSDLLELMEATVDGELNRVSLNTNDRGVVTVILTSQGYPGAYEKGKEIQGLLKATGVRIFHGGTVKRSDRFFTDGGRVLGITAVEDSLQQAMIKAYEAANLIDFEGKTMRRDIGPSVHRFYVIKEKEYRTEEKKLAEEFYRDTKKHLGEFLIAHRYDIQGIHPRDRETIAREVLGDPAVDRWVYGEKAFEWEAGLKKTLVREFLPSQFDPRNQAVEETVEMVTGFPVKSRCATVFVFPEDTSSEELAFIEHYLINPVDQRKGSLRGVPTLIGEEEIRRLDNPVFTGFRGFSPEELDAFKEEQGLVMSREDLLFVQKAFQEEDRDPNITEIKTIDTYWSDHCRHTTFTTGLTLEGPEGNTPLSRRIVRGKERYFRLRKDLQRDKPVSLMDLGTIGSADLRRQGKLDDLEISDEINACTIERKVRVKQGDNEREEDYLVLFKNETHNHPTEIEPYGGAATCLGGAIRDPLSGRGYVFGGMRISGGGNPLEPLEETLPGKLPQRKIFRDAAAGFSSYGNQVGLATGWVKEYYHPGYKAKRMEVGAVIGAVPKKQVKRLTPEPGDLVLLIGGGTGRDGIGGATGSSEAHHRESVKTAGAQVQKGNPPEERKLQRLFAREDVGKKIKKSNDFGAGGVAVAIGELADSLEIDLENLRLKTPDLLPWEIALSESQERMAVVIAPEDQSFFEKACKEENLRCEKVAKVTDGDELVMMYHKTEILRLSRKLLDSAGAVRHQEVVLTDEDWTERPEKDLLEQLKEDLTGLNGFSQKNLMSRFDSTIGGGTVLFPYGGETGNTPSQALVMGIPTKTGEAKTVAMMTCGFVRSFGEEATFLHGYYSVIDALGKLAAVGGDPLSARLSYQEYFRRLDDDPEIWGQPVKALLGALEASTAFDVAPIGGKDSMSGSFGDLHVPPGLLAFAVTTEDVERVVTPEFKGEGVVSLLHGERRDDGTVNEPILKSIFARLRKEKEDGNLLSAGYVGDKGSFAKVVEMALGNDLALALKGEFLNTPGHGTFVVETREPLSDALPVGEFSETWTLDGKDVDREIRDIVEEHLHGLDHIYPPETVGENESTMPNTSFYRLRPCKNPKKHPKVLIPVFSGTNCEWDMERAFREAGGDPEIFVFVDRTPKERLKSLEELGKKIGEAQILGIPGGFSMGDEPDGSGKYIAAVLRHPLVEQGIMKLLEDNDGLILGICNGFQALVKCGLLPYGVVRSPQPKDPHLLSNLCGRHLSRFVDLSVQTLDSPWLYLCEPEKAYRIPISHGEGRFVAGEETLSRLIAEDQIATVYRNNPNGSMENVEGLLSPDGKIFGKMGHTERVREDRTINVPNVECAPIFESAIRWMKGETPWINDDTTTR